MTDEPGIMGGEFDSRQQALKADTPAARDQRFVALWLESIDLAGKEEEDWRKAAQMVVDVYRDSKERNEKRFNILYSNVETMVPAIYSSIPSPDVRRRFDDKDPVAKVVSQMLERALTYSIDTYDFDSIMRAAALDNELVGRAVDRVRYVPYFSPDSPDVDEPAEEQAEGEDGETEATPERQAEETSEHVVDQEVEPGEIVSYEEVVCEHVPWAHFRRGPGRMWADVPWIAFELFLTREQLVDLDPTLGPKVKLDCPLDGFDESKSEGPPPEVFKRARVWEIWDKTSKQVIFIATGYKEKALRVQSDPLRLTGFFPVPRPLYAVETPDSLIPIEPYRYYKDQAEELDRITRRITKLIQVMKWRGFYPGSSEAAGVMTQLSDADDGELVPVSDMQGWVGAGGGDVGKAFWMMPIDICAKVLTELYNQREQVKQVIYEITGVADILRGSTNPNETATAQNIKSQWGSLRIQRKQAEIQRYARDLFRLKAEIMAEKFSMESLEMITGIKLMSAQDQQIAAASQPAQMGHNGGPPMAGPPGAQSAPMPPQPAPPPPPVPPEMQEMLDQPPREAVEQVMKSDLLRSYRVDIESDSTVRGDRQKHQQTMTEFLTGTGQFLTAVGPLVQEGVLPKAAAVELYLSFARQFNLGKSAEAVLDQMSEDATKADQNPQPKPNPEMMKLQADQQRHQMQMEADKAKSGLELQGLQAKTQADMQSKQMDLQMKQQELEIAKQQMAMDMQKAQMDMQMKERELEMRSRDLQLQGAMKAQSHAFGIQSMEAKNEAEMARHQRAQETAESPAE